MSSKLVISTHARLKRPLTLGDSLGGAPVEIEGNVARLHVHRSHILASKSARCPVLRAETKRLNQGAWLSDQ